MYRFDDFMADPETWRLSRGGQEIHLEPVVLKLLIYLIANRDRLVTRQELMDTVWGDTVISESALTKAVARLRRALDDDSTAPRYLETVRSRGYRFVAAVEELDRSAAVDPSPRKPRARPVGLTLFAGIAAIVTLMLLAVSWFRNPPDEVPQEEAIRSLAVLPMNNLTGDQAQDYYVDGLQDLLITELSQIAGLRVTSRQSTKRYRNSQLSTADIAAELGVDALVEGSLLREGNNLEVTIQLIDGHSDEHLWAERYTRETPYIFSLIADMAEAIGAQVSTAAPREAGAGARDRMSPIDPRAVDAYALGATHLDRFTRDEIRFAIGQLEKAVEIEPDFALAWGQLAAAHAMQALFGFTQPQDSIQIARAAALRAIEADELFYSGHSAFVWARLWTGDFVGACESFSEALRLNPSAPDAIHGDADCLMFDGRIDESIARLRELLTISPFSVMHSLPLPSHLFVARRFDEAIAAATSMQARIPQFSMHWYLAKLYWEQGLLEKAIEEERMEFEQRGDTALLAALGEGLEAAGPVGAMRAMAETLADRADESYVDPFEIAETFARAGVVDEALYWLDQAVDYGSYEVTYIAFWPHLDVLRDDPRFQNLLERVYGSRAEEFTEIGKAFASSSGDGAEENY